MENQTYMKGFILLPFYAKSNYVLPTLCVFFLLYILGVLINAVIITVICIDAKLHTPMYLFICSLALVDICYTTTTVPNLLHMLLSGDNTVSFIQCFAQLYFYLLSISSEIYLIFIMAYDPLHCTNILNRIHCLVLVSGTWVSGSINSFVLTIPASHMSFCQSHTIHQFFCDAKALINISCAGSKKVYIALYMEILIYVVFPVMFCLTSYTKMIRVILRIKCKEGRKKAFSTCSSHLTVVIMYYTTSVSVYMTPPSEYSDILESVFSVLYSVVTPIINPLIYSLRNKDVKRALLRLLGWDKVLDSEGQMDKF